MEIMIKREIDPQTFTRPMVIYAAREGVGFSPDNEGCRRVITINPGYECLIELLEGEQVIYAAIGNSGNVIYVNPGNEVIVAVASYFKPTVFDRVDFIREHIEPFVLSQK
jgi:hypothetical protein